MSPDQRSMLFGLVQRAARALAVKPELFRADLTLAVFGEARSWTSFGDPEVDRIKIALENRIDDLNLGAAIEGNSYEAHDAAQAAHLPVVRPGKAASRKPYPRRHASRYEAETAVDDPGHRRRLVYWISRLFSPAYIRRVAGDLHRTADWESLQVPQLMLLKDTLKNRLGKWLTRHKDGHDFGFSIQSRNPRSTTGVLTNEELIVELLSRRICLDLAPLADAPGERGVDRQPAPENCPF